MIKINDDIELNDLLDFHPNLWILFAFTVMYCAMFGLPFRLTSLKSDRGIKIQTPPHYDSPIRAFDFSLLGWTEQHIFRYKFAMNKIFYKYGALPFSQIELPKNKQKKLVCHDHGEGSAYHMHVQCIRIIQRFKEFEI